MKHPNGHGDYYVGNVLCALRTSLILIIIILACSSNYKLWCKSQVGEDLQKVILAIPSKTSPLSTSVQYFFVIWMVILGNHSLAHCCAILLCYLDGDFIMLVK